MGNSITPSAQIVVPNVTINHLPVILVVTYNPVTNPTIEVLSWNISSDKGISSVLRQLAILTGYKSVNGQGQL